MGVVVIVTAKIAFVFDCLHIYSMKVKVTVTPHAGDVYSLMIKCSCISTHVCFHAVYVNESFSMFCRLRLSLCCSFQCYI